ncbi:hypothetical protein B0H10DRAFT_2214524 [Mycena sp. CBHHK59/15]|nr:hypothetical protein B0H10DRAFT_2214524 [Mycena sp. CBHHK59/15]
MLRDTTNVVHAWIEKSKQPAQPSTTSDGKVRFGSGSGHLFPNAEPEPEALVNLRRLSLRLTPLADADAPADPPHLLERTHPRPPDAPAHAPADFARLRVFETTAPGGFGKTLTAADAAVIELVRFERSATTPTPSAPPPAPATASTTEPAAPAAPPPRKRFTPFHFRRHNKHDADGVKITIRLVAIDAAGRELDSPNEQTVYLLVQRFGERASPNGEDARPWVVRVVKREATIGPHTHDPRAGVRRMGRPLLALSQQRPLITEDGARLSSSSSRLAYYALARQGPILSVSIPAAHIW